MSREIGPYYDIIRALDTFDPEKESIRAVSLFEDEIVELNYDDQLYEQGIRSDGRALPDYKKTTIRNKIDAGQRYDHMTLRDTEAFHSSFKIVYPNDTSFEIVATDDKWPKLKKKYGKAILGLTPENLQFVIDKFIRPVVVETFRKKILGNR